MLFKYFNVFTQIRRTFTKCVTVTETVMKVLNVAEKNDAAKNIAFFLSNGNSRRREGLSCYNKIYDFEYTVMGQNCSMSMTSVSGHLMSYEFVGTYRNWYGCSPEDLFDAPIVKSCTQNFENIKKTLEREAKNVRMLIIWTDCDREGENIGFEVINTCTNVNPRLDVYRAKFSEITGPSIRRAISNLERPNKNISDAVDVRQELDLRIGASFTRFQTLRLKRVFPVLADHLLSYGSCQFPTLGFVVERYLERERFIPEQFWKIKVTHTIDDLTVEFRWSRDRLYDEMVCRALLARCLEAPTAKVEKVDGKPKSKWRPTPLDTTEMEKIGSRKLKINAKEVLKTAEKLYTQGFISYPRTETNIFPDSINLTNLVQLQTEDSRWGGFAQGVLQDGPNPRQGKKSDQSHPPIHPIKYTNSLQGNEARIYEFIVRHFLACVSKDAKGHETTVSIDINSEKFTASGLMILERNYLDVYPYENWNSKNIHRYEMNQMFEPTTLEMVDGQTTAPNLLTEADLISLMEKHGIGTDATHADHIETIKSRFYVGLEDNVHFVPSAIGMGLVEGYDTMGFAMSKPSLRAELEAELKRISDGIRQPDVVLREQVRKYKELFKTAKEQVNKIDLAVGKYLQTTAVPLNPSDDPLSVVAQTSQKVMPCPLCGLDMVLKTTADTRKHYISCMGYPSCKSSIWLPQTVLDVTVSEQTCERCGPNVRKLDFKFTPGSMSPYYQSNHTDCLNGCNNDFVEMLEVRLPRPGAAAFSTRTNVSQQSNRSGNTTASSTRTNHSQQSNRSGNTTAASRSNPSSQNHGSSSWPTGMRGTSDSGFFGSNSMESNSRGSYGGSSRGSAGGNNRGSPAGNNRGQKRPRDDNDSNSGQPQCFCNLPTKRLTVRKEGPNVGREFLVCSKDTEDKCGFYAWADELSEISLKCFCDAPAKKLVVKKEGPNKGRTFFSCQKMQHDPSKCSFFLWEDDNSEQGSNQRNHQSNNNNFRNDSSNNSRNTSRNNQSFRARVPGTSQGGNRKCGLCSQVGHNRRNCPNNQE